MTDKTSETIPAPAPAFAVGDRVKFKDGRPRSMRVERVDDNGMLAVSWHRTGTTRGGEIVDSATVRKSARRGFLAMSVEKQQAIASTGGKQAHVKGTAHVFDADEAREAGRKGGAARHAARAGEGST